AVRPIPAAPAQVGNGAARLAHPGGGQLRDAAARARTPAGGGEALTEPRHGLSRRRYFALLAPSLSRETQLPWTWLRSAMPVLTFAIGPFSISSASITHSSDE